MDDEEQQKVQFWLWNGLNGFWVRLLVTLALGAWLLWWKLVVPVWLKPAKTRRHFLRQGVGGPPPLPVLGNLKELGELMAAATAQPMAPSNSHNILPRVLPFYHQWNKIYAISDPALIREVLVTSSDLYEKYEAHPLVKKLEGNGLLSLLGQTWAHRRKIISPIFHIENLKLMIPVMATSVASMVEKWSVICTSGSAEIDVYESFQNLAEEFITRAIFGGCYEDGKAIYQLQSQLMIFAGESFQKIFIPGYKFLPTRRNRAIWRLDREIQTLLSRLIEKKRKSLEGRCQVDESGPQDLLEHLITESLKKNENGIKITGEDVMEECKTFFFAGKNTTSNLMVWITVVLAMHPEWQLLAREEVLKVCGARDTPSKDHISGLKTLGMIINEVLRLYSPVVAEIRRTKANTELGGYNIPKGTELLLPILAVHHDPSLWGPGVHEFNPNRFAQGVSQAATYPTAFMPFGLGARQCIGQNLAIFQAKLAMAMILQRFSFELSPNYSHAPTVLMFLYPQFNAPLIFHRI
ncbi:hypothetical protein V2J09_023512 [Rumex salicifolius]